MECIILSIDCTEFGTHCIKKHEPHFIFFFSSGSQPKLLCTAIFHREYLISRSEKIQ